MKLRFQADADLNEDIVTGILRREPGVDFQKATTAGLRLLSDLQVLTLAAREGRVFVSHDRRTMPQAFGEFVSSNMSPGVFIVSQKTDLLTAIDDLLLVWATSEAEEWINQLGTIPFWAEKSVILSLRTQGPSTAPKAGIDTGLPEA